MFKTLRPYLKPYKKQLFLGPFFKLLEAIFELILPIYLAKLIDNGLIKHNLKSIYINTLIIIILSLIGLLCVFICQYYASIASQGFGTALRENTLHHIQKLPTSVKQKLGVNTLITRMTSDINQLQQAVAMLIRLVIRAPFLSIGAIIMAFTINKTFGYLFIAILPCFVFLLAWIMKQTVPIYEKTQKSTDLLNQTIIDNLTGQEIIRSFNQTSKMLNAFHEYNKNYTKNATKAGYIASILQPGTIFMVNIGIAITLCVSCSLIQNKQILPGELVALITYMSQILLALIVIANLVTLFTKAFASGKRISSLLNIKIDDNKNLISNIKTPISLNINCIGYRYTDTSGDILEDISVNIPTSSTLGITGSTGSGKTTFLKLVQGIIKPTYGEIANNDTNIISYGVKNWQKHVAITTQKAELFDGTIRSNLLWGNAYATDEELWQILEIVCLKDEVSKMPNKLDTKIIKQGQNFSGGQKQRLSLARALLKNSDILLLDDTFTALDAKTSKTILNNLNMYYPNTIKIIVTQQLAILKQLDQIMILDEGKISNLGTHEKLKQTSTLYQLLIKQQEEA